MDLGLRTTGRASKHLEAEVLRDLGMVDIEQLQREKGSKPQPIKQLRQRHHALAKLLATGVPEGEAALTVGYVGSHVSILKADPSFQELLKFYSEKADAEFIDVTAKIAALGEDVVDELSGRLEEDPDGFTIGQLLEVSKMALDRSGHGPQTNTTVNVNVGLADKLAKGRQRTLEARAQRLRDEQIIDITPEVDDAG